MLKSYNSIAAEGFNEYNHFLDFYNTEDQKRCEYIKNIIHNFLASRESYRLKDINQTNVFTK